MRFLSEHLSNVEQPSDGHTAEDILLSSLADQSSLIRSVDVDTPLGELLVIFEASDLQGVAVTESNNAVGVLTRVAVQRVTARHGGGDAVGGRLLRDVIGSELPLALTLPESMHITNATVRGLERDGADRYDPIAVTCADGGLFLVSFNAVLEANCRFLGATLVELQRQREAAQMAEAEMLHAALHDQLTGLANRRQVLEHLDMALACRGEGRGEFVVIFLDCDRFKLINDSLGHDIGNELLGSVASRLLTVTNEWLQEQRPQAKTVAGRLGGDEFVIVAYELDDYDCGIDLARRICRVLRAPHRLTGAEVYSSASVGVTTSHFAYSEPSDVMRDADAAMYRAKFCGKDRVAVFDASMHKEQLDRLEIETALRRAQAREELCIHYQPIVAIESGRIIGAEALIRWRRGGQLIGPDTFISIAEESGMIVPIGRWCYQQALHDLASLRKLCPWLDPAFTFSVNVSKRQLLEPTFLDDVQAAHAATGIDPTQTTIEITETAVIEKAEFVRPILNDLKSMGMRLAMDDFGVGHSSLTSLQTFPIDVIKIDRGFVRHLETDRSFSAVVYAVVSLARNLDMRVVVEGVETEGQLAQVQAMDCDLVQGFYFAPALTIRELARMLHDVNLQQACAA